MNCDTGKKEGRTEVQALRRKGIEMWFGGGRISACNPSWRKKGRWHRGWGFGEGSCLDDAQS